MEGAATPASERPRLLSEEEKKHFDSRRSTFDTFPQCLFPTSAKVLNRVPSTLETPYAYSHHQAAFYWTQEDAKLALIWNFLSRPPCLNCVLLGEGVAKRCDRMERQRRSQGQVRCCNRCNQGGRAEACIEMVEIRIAPRFVTTLPSGRVFRPRFNKYGIDMFLWTDEEKALRKQGRDVWRPLNLEVGDVETKKKLAADFAAGGAGDITRFCISPPIMQQEMSSSEYRAWWVAQRMMKRKTNRWDREEAEPESEWASLLGGMARGQARPTNKDTAKDVVRLDGPDDNKENEQSHHRVQLSTDIEAQSQRWVSSFRQIRQEQYERDVRDLGTFEAQKNDSRWKLDGPKMMTSIRSFFKQKQIFLEKERKRGNDEDEAEQYASWESARILDEESRDLLEEFVPGMLLPLETRSKAEM